LILLLLNTHVAQPCWAAIKIAPSTRLSVRPNAWNLRTDKSLFDDIWYWRIFRKIIEPFKCSFWSDNFNADFTRKHSHVFPLISTWLQQTCKLGYYSSLVISTRLQQTCSSVTVVAWLSPLPWLPGEGESSAMTSLPPHSLRPRSGYCSQKQTSPASFAKVKGQIPASTPELLFCVQFLTCYFIDFALLSSSATVCHVRTFIAVIFSSYNLACVTAAVNKHAS
jgi:hypothetical protein